MDIRYYNLIAVLLLFTNYSFCMPALSQEANSEETWLEPINDYYTKSQILISFDSLKVNEINNRKTDSKSKTCNTPSLEDAQYLAEYEAAKRVRSAIKDKLDSIISIVSETNTQENSLWFYYIIIKEVWNDDLECGTYVKHKEHQYCSLEVSMEKGKIEELEEITDPNKVYYCLER